MGNPDNITEATLKHLSGHWGKSLPETKAIVLKILEEDKISDSHLAQMFEKAAKAWGQTIEEAKKNTQSLLKNG